MLYLQRLTLNGIQGFNTKVLTLVVESCDTTILCI